MKNHPCFWTFVFSITLCMSHIGLGYAEDVFKQIEYFNGKGGLYSGKALLDDSNIKIDFFRAAPNSFNIRILTPQTAAKIGQATGSRPTNSIQRSYMSQGLNMHDFAEVSGALAVLGAGYVSSFDPVTPLGFVQSDGSQVSYYSQSWLVDALLCTQNGKPVLGPSNELYKNRASYSDCLQVGPMLVEDGKPVFYMRDGLTTDQAKLLQETHPQSFVCIDDDANFIMGVTAPVKLEALTQFLTIPLTKAGMGCKIAARLAAGLTATLVTHGGVIGADKYLLPAAIAVFPLIKSGTASSQQKCMIVSGVGSCAFSGTSPLGSSCVCEDTSGNQYQGVVQ
jgi:hypothetical protein